MSAENQYILALDQGTTSSRSIVFNSEGHIASIAQKEFRQFFPQPGWVEHDPMEIWSSTAETIGKALTEIYLTAQDIAAVGITNQRETVVVWERETGEPIYNAIVWQDRRTAADIDQWREEGLEKTIQEKTGLVLDPYFSASKVRWILENVEGARARAQRGELAFGTIDSWLVWNLTNGAHHLTDISNASRTMLFNIHTKQWDKELLEIFEIPSEMLPEVRSSSELYGNTREIIRSVPIAGIAGDQQAALFGQCCFEPGMAKNTYGTGCFLLKNTGTTPITSKNNLLTTIAWQIGDEVEYALEGSVFVGGAVIQWLRDELGILPTAPSSEHLAASVPDNGGVYFVPAFTGLGAPHWDPYARGMLIGITRGTSVGHIARAALEAIAFQSEDLLRCMAKDSGIEVTELRVDGGASLNNILMQFQADLLQVPVVRPLVPETTALGAAYLAGLAVGYWPSRKHLSSHWAQDAVFRPQKSNAEMEPYRRHWRRALEAAKGWAKEP